MIAFAGNEQDPAAPEGNAVATPFLSGVNHKLLNTKIDYTAGGSALSSGFNTIDSNSVNCTNSGGCTIGFGLMVQVGAGPAVTGNRWAICALVDGHLTNPGAGCPFQGDLLANGHYVVGNSRQNLTVAFGSHRVTTEVYIDSGSARLGESEFDYLVYKP
jgi:hypothetical protein